MIIKLGKYYLFYRHLLYGSALVIGTIIGTQGIINHTIAYIFLISGGMLMANSVFITFVINMHPEEFKEELKRRAKEQGVDESDLI